MKKTIFMVETLSILGGVEKVVSNWANFFSKNNRNVEIVITDNKASVFELESSIKLVNLPLKVRYKLFKLIDLIPNTIKLYFFLKNQKNANVIFNRSFFIEPIWILRKFGLLKNQNLVYFNHGGSSSLKSFYGERKFSSHRLKMMFKGFDKVISLYDNETSYPKTVDLNKLRFINNTLPFSPSDIDFCNKKNIVLALSRITREKGIDILIKAWDLIKDKVGNWELYIVGEGKDKDNFIQLSKELNIKNIKFFDGTTDVKPYYEMSKIYVLPSLIEGFGLTIIEAMACKCAVVSSNTEGGNYLISDQYNGEKFKINDFLQLSNILINLINNEMKIKQYSDIGYKFVNKFTIDNISGEWKYVFK